MFCQTILIRTHYWWQFCFNCITLINNQILIWTWICLFHKGCFLKILLTNHVYYGCALYVMKQSRPTHISYIRVRMCMHTNINWRLTKHHFIYSYGMIKCIRKWRTALRVRARPRWPSTAWRTCTLSNRRAWSPTWTPSWR